MRYQGLDPLEILKTIGIATIDKIEPIVGGLDTAIWKVEVAQVVYVLRVARSDQTESSKCEVEAMLAARASGLPVPIVHHFAIWHDRPVLLLSWCSGHPLIKALIEDPKRAYQLGRSCGRLQAQIHTVAAPEYLLENPNLWLKKHNLQEEYLSKLLQKTSLRKNTLLHFDFHPLNLLTDNSNITAILDWQSAMAGDPRVDVARTCAQIQLFPKVFPILGQDVFDTLSDEWYQGYEEVAGPLQDMGIFRMLIGEYTLREHLERIENSYDSLQEWQLEPLRHWIKNWHQQLFFDNEQL